MNKEHFIEYDNNNITEDTKIILSIIKPTLKNIDGITEILNEIANDIHSRNKDVIVIKRILIGEEDQITAGEGPGGIKKDVNSIYEIIRSHNLDESKIIEKIDENQRTSLDILKTVKDKIPWTARVTGIKDIAMSLGIIITAIISIMSLLQK